MKALIVGLMGSVSAAVLAQSGPGLVLRPFPKDASFQLSGEAAVFGDAEADDTDEDVELTIYLRQYSA
ncbi:MAG TPA: hypothetical protein VLH09_12895 [Bryobacteraceae bacterium]|nr:hypothetical protein [Bryobacteraceae bacterium]